MPRTYSHPVILLFSSYVYSSVVTTTIALVGYHQTNTTITVFYSVLGGLSGHCLLKTAPHFHRQSSDHHLNSVSFDPA